MVTLLIIEAEERGYEVTLGEAYRSPEEAKRLKFKNSLHTQRLAIDINLFKNGRYLDTTEAHRPLGEWWEEQRYYGVKPAWGGRFGDGNHYSVEHNGRK